MALNSNSFDNIGGPKIDKPGNHTINFSGLKPPPQEIVLRNDSGSRSEWLIAEGEISWLVLNPSNGTLNDQETVTVSASVIAGKLQGKSGSTMVFFAWNHPESSPLPHENVLTVKYIKQQ